VADDQHRDDAPGRGAARASGVRAPERRVLIVDDVADNRELYAMSFEAAGYTVELAADGHEALEKIAACPPDVVVSDLSMPNLDGWETTQRIKSSPATRHILVVVVTGHATPEDLARARASGADEVCTKPCLPADLLAKVKSLLAR